MNRKVLVVCILLLHTLLSYAKQAKVYGRVTDDKGNPIEHCLVKAANSGYAAYTNKLGEFFLVYNTDSSGSLILVYEGYETQEVSIDNDALWVILKHKVTGLNDVVVTADYDGGRIKQGVLGKKNLKPYGICTGKRGSEVAIFLRAGAARRGLLQQVFFYIAKEGEPNTPFKVHVYSIDTTHLPGADLLDSEVVLHADKGDEWVSVDLSARRIPLGKGVFISMEWISGSSTNPDMVDGAKRHKGKEKFDGQVLSFTKGYHMQGSLFYVRNQTIKWYFSDLHDDGMHKLNPMIYATYTYVKK